jgi:amidase
VLRRPGQNQVVHPFHRGLNGCSSGKSAFPAELVGDNVDEDMNDLDICFLDAVDLAAKIRRRELSAREVMAAHQTQIERVNCKVNAFITLVDPEVALNEALIADETFARGEQCGPLHGLPIAHKDLQDTAGLRTTYGSTLFADHIPKQDSLLVERIKRAGAIVIGKTTTPEFGAGSQTFSPVFGTTVNPYDLAKTCGGSTGGGAVALACGMTTLADGSDMGGSLRNPAGFCNVVGLRPSPGRVPRWPADLAWSTLTVDGPIARTVTDAALLLSVIAGPDARSPISILQPGSIFSPPLEREFKGVRVAWCKDLGGLPFDREVRTVVDSCRSIFEDLGCVIDDAEPDFTGADEAFRTFRAMSFESWLKQRLGLSPGMLKQTITEEIERGSALSGPDIGRAARLQTDLYHRIRGFMETYEFFILPVTQVPPFDADQQYVTEIAGVAMGSYIDWMRSCYYISVAGNPAISVPCGFTSKGLPVGAQIVGRHHDDLGVLQLGHAFERVTRFGETRPAIAT